ncbi:unnamed protein product [Nippostrongylus brasiliensis]|uniref:FAT domain-containing protein n=1 Tax=Nippostrongylus brasiliensis TaxID=27835 RepID=A0A0N4YL54_NIPBR|nr:unnamed protein product [Nippostrongylus brasiliensis]
MVGRVMGRAGNRSLEQCFNSAWNWKSYWQERSQTESKLALIRAEILYEQLRDWSEAYHLSEILANEDENDVYERMKDAALRIGLIRPTRCSQMPTSPYLTVLSQTKPPPWINTNVAKPDAVDGLQVGVNTFR